MIGIAVGAWSKCLTGGGLMLCIAARDAGRGLRGFEGKTEKATDQTPES